MSKCGDLSGSGALSVGQWGTGRAVLIWGRSWGDLALLYVIQELADLLPPLCAQVHGFLLAARGRRQPAGPTQLLLPSLCPSPEPHFPLPWPLMRWAQSCLCSMGSTLALLTLKLKILTITAGYVLLLWTSRVQ